MGKPARAALSEGAAWLPDRNGVLIPKHGKLASEIAGKLRDAVVASGEITVEVWAKADNITQGGPARLVTYSFDGELRNFTLAQQLEQIHVRFRASETKLNGWPYLTHEGGFDTAVSHFVFTFDGTNLSLYKDGRFIKSEPREADLSSWDPTHYLVIGNEYAASRPWTITQCMPWTPKPANNYGSER